MAYSGRTPINMGRSQNLKRLASGVRLILITNAVILTPLWKRKVMDYPDGTDGNNKSQHT